MSKVIYMKGEKFGRLTVVRRAKNANNRKAMWECTCECGKKTIVIGYQLRSGRTKSCGCLRIETTSNNMKRHGMINSSLYCVWASMKSRCLNPNTRCYHRYGGRGIKICKEWIEFLPFYNWATENGFEDGLKLDRINNDRDYEPKNCRFVTHAENMRNMNCNVKYKGECASEASRRLGGNPSLVSCRIFQGMSVEEAFTTPLRKKGQVS